MTRYAVPYSFHKLLSLIVFYICLDGHLICPFGVALRVNTSTDGPKLLASSGNFFICRFTLVPPLQFVPPLRCVGTVRSNNAFRNNITANECKKQQFSALFSKSRGLYKLL